MRAVPAALGAFRCGALSRGQLPSLAAALTPFRARNALGAQGPAALSRFRPARSGKGGRAGQLLTAAARALPAVTTPGPSRPQPAPPRVTRGRTRRANSRESWVWPKWRRCARASRCAGRAPAAAAPGLALGCAWSRARAATSCCSPSAAGPPRSSRYRARVLGGRQRRPGSPGMGGVPFRAGAAPVPVFPLSRLSGPGPAVPAAIPVVYSRCWTGSSPGTAPARPGHALPPAVPLLGNAERLERLFAYFSFC